MYVFILSLTLCGMAYALPPVEKELNQLSIAKAIYAACVNDITRDNEEQHLAIERLYTKMAEHFFSKQGGKETFDALYQIQFNSLRDAYLQGVFNINTERCNANLQSANYTLKSYLEERMVIQQQDGKEVNSVQ